MLRASARAAAPPPNDNYLASTTISGQEYRDSVDTTEATTQADMFNPNRDGLPSGGGDPEPTSCAPGASYGKTVWWDFRPPSDGGVEIRANGGFDVVVAVYTWNERTSRITRSVRCQNDEAGVRGRPDPPCQRRDQLHDPGRRRQRRRRAAEFDLGYFPDTDGDGILDDAPDKCCTQPGIERSAAARPSCAPPPRLSLTPSAAPRCGSSPCRSTTSRRAPAPRSAAAAAAAAR